MSVSVILCIVILHMIWVGINIYNITISILYLRLKETITLCTCYVNTQWFLNEVLTLFTLDFVLIFLMKLFNELKLRGLKLTSNISVGAHWVPKSPLSMSFTFSLKKKKRFIYLSENISTLFAKF